MTSVEPVVSLQPSKKLGGIAVKFGSGAPGVANIVITEGGRHDLSVKAAPGTRPTTVLRVSSQRIQGVAYCQ